MCKIWSDQKCNYAELEYFYINIVFKSVFDKNIALNAKYAILFIYLIITFSIRCSFYFGVSLREMFDFVKSLCLKLFISCLNYGNKNKLHWFHHNITILMCFLGPCGNKKKSNTLNWSMFAAVCMAWTCKCQLGSTLLGSEHRAH